MKRNTEGADMKEKYYRLGHVLKKVESNLGCCHHTYVDCCIFDYIEVVYEDDVHRFFYENEKEFEHFERNFVSRRFTSYHEFFTTEDTAVEERGFMKLKYFVRLGADSYEKTDLKAKEMELDALSKSGKVERISDRITMYGEYDVVANNHWNEDTRDVEWIRFDDKACEPIGEYRIMC